MKNKHKTKSDSDLGKHDQKKPVIVDVSIVSDSENEETIKDIEDEQHNSLRKADIKSRLGVKSTDGGHFNEEGKLNTSQDRKQQDTPRNLCTRCLFLFLSAQRYLTNN